MKLWTPTPRTTPDRWGASNRIYPPTTGKPGWRDPTYTPYMIPWARTVGEGIVPLSVFVCGAQMGKTDTQLDIIGERLDTRPGPILYVGPSKDFNTEQFGPRFEELLGQSKSLRGKITPGKRQKQTLKWIAGVRVRLAHAGSSTQLKSDPAALALMDEYEEMLQNVKGQGDPLGLVRARGFTHADFVTAVTSTPKRGLVDTEMDLASGLEFFKIAPPEDLESAIWRLFQLGTMHHWAWPCPHCRAYFVPMRKHLHYPEQVSAARARREAALKCPVCAELIVDEAEGENKGATKKWMNDRGVMICKGQWINAKGRVEGEPAADTNVVSYWASGLASPFVSWGERVEEIVAAEISGDPAAMQTAVNAGCGETYAPGGGDLPAWKEVLECRMPSLILPKDPEEMILPPELVLLTAGVDVQKKSLPYVIRGWGPRATSWLVDYGELYGPTNQPDVWDALDDLFQQRWGGLMVKVAFIDSGFRPAKTDAIPQNIIYEFCRNHRRFTWPTKGHDVQTVPLKKAKIEVQPTGGAAKFGLELVHLDSDFWKSWVHERIRWNKAKPGGWYLHKDTTENYARQIVSEARMRKPDGKPQWIRRSRENHFLDCEALAAAAGYMLNVHRIALTAKRDGTVDSDEDQGEATEAPSGKQAPAKPGEAPAPPPAAAIPATKDAVFDKYAKMAAQTNLSTRR